MVKVVLHFRIGMIDMGRVVLALLHESTFEEQQTLIHLRLGNNVGVNIIDIGLVLVLHYHRS